MRCHPLLLGALLVACTGHGDPEPSAWRAAEAYLKLHNEWDPEAASALWGEKLDTFGEMTFWFREQVGPCTDFTSMKITSLMHARFVFDCQRGQLEIEFEVDETTGVVEGVRAGARGFEPPIHVRQMAEQVVALANGDPVSEPAFGGKLDSEKFRKELDQISAHEPCRIDRVHLGTPRGGRFILECDDGSMTMLVDLTRDGELRRFGADKGAADKWRNKG